MTDLVADDPIVTRRSLCFTVADDVVGASYATENSELARRPVDPNWRREFVPQ